ncbi:hypothetical protein [Aminivibrio sp.]|jgi:hypothetical protein|uniref:hypothetical protein n=1 Tax=Aminivibrio sp. TaxID=1872489 RepID=UPI003D98E9C8
MKVNNVKRNKRSFDDEKVTPLKIPGRWPRQKKRRSFLQGDTGQRPDVGVREPFP